ncbi:activator-dependent family glycosyltransferase [Prauserella cavernicola]|uniref:Activator-dependent family glycosyltransferase n=1 Tax=Prauserella cavernicola TaxID=2800127 RepID=A0A934QWF2_9PSEU|nr:activator-dependent family glycosyltransferase [Prauserella cavernicola]MBK1787860.1 activator-dependent family glycosyltransferase [Prauserella cavernicola]
MRILFATYAEKTHLLAMTPLAWAARTAGHEVSVASQPELTDEITRAGLTAVPVGRNHRIWRMIELNPEWMEADQGGISEPYDVAEAPDKATWEYLTNGYAEAVPGWHRLENATMIAGLVEYARYWQPDLVIWDPSTYAGAIAAKACGAVHGRLMFSVDIFGFTRARYLDLARERGAHDRADPLADWLGGYARKYGAEFSEDMVTGQFTVDQLPDPLRLDPDTEHLPMRYIPYGGAAVVPEWTGKPPERPRVALTLGVSTKAHLDQYAVSVKDILASIADLDIEVVATVSDSAQGELGTIPDNARIVPYVPLHALAPSCSAVIHHAGPGTLCTMALGGVVQLALPWLFDEPLLARQLASQGAGLATNATDATGESVRDDLLRLLREPRFQTRADELRDGMLAQPTPNQIVTRLEELAVEYRH